MLGKRGTIQPFLWLTVLWLVLTGVLYVLPVPIYWPRYVAMSLTIMSFVTIIWFMVLRQSLVHGQQMKFLGLFLGSVVMDMAIGGGFMFYMIKVLGAEKVSLFTSFFAVFFSFLYLKATNLVYLSKVHHEQ